MIPFILAALIAFIGALFVMYIRQRGHSRDNTFPLLPANPHNLGLFDQPDPLFRDRDRSANENEKLLERARCGDLSVLDEAQSRGNANLYAVVLDRLSEWASERQERIVDLVTHISKRSELRGNKQLAQLYSEPWKAAPDRRSTAQMIHIAALSDDIETFDRAVDKALDLWRAGALPAVSARELAELFASEYWIIAPEARGGGLGFALKRKLIAVRRELSTCDVAH